MVFSVGPPETSDHQCASQLDSLLAEPPDVAAERRQRHAERYQEQRMRYVLYGAGQLGRTTLAKLRAAGVEPVAFADDTPEKHGQVVDGLSVLPPEQVCKRFDGDVVFVVTILNPGLNFLTAQHRLHKLTGAPTISFLDLAWIYPDQFLPYGPFEVPQDVLAKAGDIRRGFDLLADSESRAQFVGHLRLRLHRDYKALPPCVADDYFPKNVFPPLPPDVIFVDCGAFDGDTLRAFLRQQAESFESIYAFEPDPANYNRLREYVSSLGSMADRIHLFNAGVGEERARLRFNAAGNMASSFGPDGSVDVDVLPIDEVVKANSGSVYLKLDVEGGEYAALKGCRNLLQQRPLMAVSVYHRPDDLWRLPIFIDSLGLNYQTFLRTQGEDGMDVIAYFVPARV